MEVLLLVLIAVVIVFGFGVIIVSRMRARRGIDIEPPAPLVPAPPAAPPPVEVPPETEAEIEEALAPVEVEPAPEAVEVIERPRFRDRLAKARATFTSAFTSVRSRGGIDEATWDHFDDGVEGSPNVWLFVGVNGVGKTTTIGKIGFEQTHEGRSVVMAAGDTFRAAAAEQLHTWAERAGADFVRGNEGGDPSAVIFDAVQRAAARGQDLVLGVTAGRLHTKT